MKHHGPERLLPSKLQAAFDRLAPALRSAPGPASPLPKWPRSVRLAIDYSLRVAVADIVTDEAADDFAWTCMVLGALQKQDPVGDPPATVTAYEAAERAGPEHAQAFSVLGTIRDCTDAWTERGWATPALPPSSMAILQRAGRGEPGKASDLAAVLEAAQDLVDRLSYPLLSRSS